MRRVKFKFVRTNPKQKGWTQPIIVNINIYSFDLLIWHLLHVSFTNHLNEIKYAAIKKFTARTLFCEKMFEYLIHLAELQIANDRSELGKRQTSGCLLGPVHCIMIIYTINENQRFTVHSYILYSRL